MIKFKQIHKAAEGYLINRDGVVLNPSGRALKPFGNNQVKIKYLSGQMKTVAINVLVERNFGSASDDLPIPQISSDEKEIAVAARVEQCSNDNVAPPTQISEEHASSDDPTPVVREVLESPPDQPITPENIQEVLEYNGIDKKRYGIEVNVEYGELILSFKNERWLEHLQVELGKLKPLPAFNFAQYLLDNGFQQCSDGVLELYPLWFNPKLSNLCDDARQIKPTKRNAELIVSMSKLSEQLEY